MTEQDQLTEVLGYAFKDHRLLEQALTHSSAAQQKTSRLDSNERLEFLGDRALGLIMAEWLYRRFPDEEEGALARRFAALVRRETLAMVAENIELGRFIILNKNDESTIGRNNISILADACEAILGALYLDGGLEVTRRFIEQQWVAFLESDLKPPQDAKTALQEWAQGQGLPLPQYSEINRQGPSHDPVFTIEVAIDGQPSFHGEGTSKRLAEQAAAELLLAHIRQ